MSDAIRSAQGTSSPEGASPQLGWGLGESVSSGNQSLIKVPVTVRWRDQSVRSGNQSFLRYQLQSGEILIRLFIRVLDIMFI